MLLNCVDCGYVIPRVGTGQYPPPGGCPKCGSNHLGMHLVDDVPAPSDELFLHMKSDHSKDEVAIAVGAQGDESRHEVSDETSQRSTRHKRPYRQEKVAEEVAAASRVLTALNAEFRTSFNRVEPEDDQDHAVDVWAIAPDGTRLGIQITKPDTKVWRDIARGEHHQDNVSRDDFLVRITSDVVARKSHFDAFNVVLVLDGWGIVAPGVLREMRAIKHHEFAALGFHSVWFCNRGAAGHVERLDVPAPDQP